MKMNRVIFFTVLIASLVGCGKSDPRLAAEKFWTAVQSNDWDGARSHSSESSVSSIVITDEILPLSELKDIRIQHLKLQQLDDKFVEPDSEPEIGLVEYDPGRKNYALGYPIVKPDHVIIPTTIFSDWDGRKLTWHLNTRLINESGKWKVDFISLKYSIQQQLESETRDVLMSETRNFSRSVRETIGASAREMAEQFK